MILPCFDHLPASKWTFLFTLNVGKNLHFWTTYPPHHVHLVIERPLVCFIFSQTFQRHWKVFTYRNKDSHRTQQTSKKITFLVYGVPQTCDRYSNLFLVLISQNPTNIERDYFFSIWSATDIPQILERNIFSTVEFTKTRAFLHKFCQNCTILL